MAARNSNDLLSQIEAGAHDQSTDLASLLRRCVSLGGVTGSIRLRDWATRELKGYGTEDEVPTYRNVPAPSLVLDGATMQAWVTGQAVPANMVPDFARERLSQDISFRQGVAQLADLVNSTRQKNENFIRLEPPGASTLVALINHELAAHDQNKFGWVPGGLPPSRVVERLYWTVSLTTIVGILDIVRTTLVELVSEMRAGTPGSGSLPTHDVAEQAVDVAIYGKHNRVVINQVAPDGVGTAAAGGVASSGGSHPESRPRRTMWWIVGIAGVVAAAAAVIALFH